MQYLKQFFRPTTWLVIAIFATGFFVYKQALVVDGVFGTAEIFTAAVWILVCCERGVGRAWARPTAVFVLLSLAVWLLISGLSVGSIVAAACFIWTALTEFKPETNDSTEDDEPIQSIVLLQNEPRYLDAMILSRLISEAWEIEVKLAEDDSSESDSEADNSDQTELTTATLIGDSGSFICMYWPALFVIHNHPVPYVEDLDALVDGLADVRLKEAVASHTSWLSVDLLKWMNEDQERGRAIADKLIGQLLAEICDDTCVAVVDLMSDRIYPADPELINKLRTDSPREALAELYYPPITAISSDDPELIAAVEQATQSWPEFVDAFEKRHQDSSCESFSIKAPFGETDDPEFMWVSVSAIEGDVIYGELGNDPATVTSLKSGDKVNVPLANLNDWMYLRDGNIVGAFTVGILMKRYRQAAGENDNPAEDSGD